MKANELRIGNWVNNNPRDGVITVFSNDKCVIRHKAGIDRAFIEELEPIPLTEEWLLKFEFERNKYALNSFIKNDVIISTDKFIYMSRTKLKYVHQLQNLYFALTGEELKLKEDESKTD